MKEFFYVIWLVFAYSITGIKNIVSSGYKNVSTSLSNILDNEDLTLFLNCLFSALWTIIAILFVNPNAYVYFGVIVAIIIFFNHFVGHFTILTYLLPVLGILIGTVISIVVLELDTDRYDKIGVVEFAQEKIYKDSSNNDVMSVDINGKTVELKIPVECRYNSLEFIVANHITSVHLRPDLTNYVLLCNEEKVKASIDERNAKRVVKMEPLSEDKK